MTDNTNLSDSAPSKSAPSDSEKSPNTKPLKSLRIIESSLLGPGFLTTFLADLGAEVIKVEPPQGDYIRQMTWPIINGVSLLHLHTHRGKKSITLNLKTPEGIEVYLDLVRKSDAVVEAMRPGSLERMGLGFDKLQEVNPKIVLATISGYGATGPYKNMPSHGVAYDTWAGLIEPALDDQDFYRIPNALNVGINVGPMLGALGLLAGITHARTTGQGMQIEVAQSDAAAYMDWLRIETYQAYNRPESEVTGNPADNYERRAPGMAGMWEGVRYQIYESSDGFVMFMASEQAFWRNFCQALDRMDLFERWEGSKFADHARGNLELQAELKKIFKTKSSKQWLDFSNEANTPIAPVNTPQSLMEDPQFKDRMPWLPKEELDAEQLPLPIRIEGDLMDTPSKAPELGQHTEEVFTSLLEYDDQKIKDLKDKGVYGGS